MLTVILEQIRSTASSSSSSQASHMEYKKKSSTAWQATSPMENKKVYPKIEPFRHRHIENPKFFARALKALTQAISEFYAQGSTSMSLELLYRDAYSMILYKKGQEMYSAMEITMASEVQSLFRSLDDAAPEDGATFLKLLLAKWNHHIEAAKMTRDIPMYYMDRTFVLTNRKTPINELGLRLWRDHLAGSDKIRERLTEAVKAVKQQGGGDDDELVAGVKKMLTELGEDFPGLFFPDGELNVAGP